MRSWLALVATALLSAGVCACGASSGPDGTAAAKRPVPRADRDNDGDNNDDDGNVLYFGQAAGPSDRQALIALVTRYYTAAAAANGGTVCGLLAPFVAETVVETSGSSPALRGRSCAAVLTKLFKLQHSLLADKRATLQIGTVRVQGDRALVSLNFTKPIVETRQLTGRRIAGDWRLIDILDGIVE